MGTSGLPSQESDASPQDRHPSLKSSLDRSEASQVGFCVVRPLNHEPLTRYHRLQSIHRLVVHVAHVPLQEDAPRLEDLEQVTSMWCPQAEPPPLFKTLNASAITA